MLSPSSLPSLATTPYYSLLIQPLPRRPTFVFFPAMLFATYYAICLHTIWLLRHIPISSSRMTLITPGIMTDSAHDVILSLWFVPFSYQYHLTFCRLSYPMLSSQTSQSNQTAPNQRFQSNPTTPSQIWPRPVKSTRGMFAQLIVET